MLTTSRLVVSPSCSVVVWLLMMNCACVCSTVPILMVVCSLSSRVISSPSCRNARTAIAPSFTRNVAAFCSYVRQRCRPSSGIVVGLWVVLVGSSRGSGWLVVCSVAAQLLRSVRRISSVGARSFFICLVVVGVVT